MSAKPKEDAKIIFKCTEEERQQIEDIGRRAGANTTEAALRFVIADYLKRHKLPAGPGRVPHKDRA